MNLDYYFAFTSEQLFKFTQYVLVIFCYCIFEYTIDEQDPEDDEEEEKTLVTNHSSTTSRSSTANPLHQHEFEPKQQFKSEFTAELNLTDEPEKNNDDIQHAKDPAPASATKQQQTNTLENTPIQNESNLKNEQMSVVLEQNESEQNQKTLDTDFSKHQKNQEPVETKPKEFKQSDKALTCTKSVADHQNYTLKAHQPAISPNPQTVTTEENNYSNVHSIEKSSLLASSSANGKTKQLRNASPLKKQQQQQQQQIYSNEKKETTLQQKRISSPAQNRNSSPLKKQQQKQQQQICSNEKKETTLQQKRISSPAQNRNSSPLKKQQQQQRQQISSNESRISSPAKNKDVVNFSMAKDTAEAVSVSNDEQLSKSIPITPLKPNPDLKRQNQESSIENESKEIKKSNEEDLQSRKSAPVQQRSILNAQPRKSPTPQLLSKAKEQDRNVSKVHSTDKSSSLVSSSGKPKQVRNASPPKQQQQQHQTAKKETPKQVAAQSTRRLDAVNLSIDPSMASRVNANPLDVLKDHEADWKIRLHAISKLDEFLSSGTPNARDNVSKALAVQIADPRSHLASEALDVTTHLASQLGTGTGPAELLQALLKVASNLRVKGTRDQAAQAIRELCSKRGDGPLARTLAKAADGSAKTGEFAQAIAMQVYLERLPRKSQEFSTIMQMARAHRSPVIRDVAKKFNS
jgi:hypothetical protein